MTDCKDDTNYFKLNPDGSITSMYVLEKKTIQPYRIYYGFKKDGKVIAMINRTFADAISVKLPCGYHQRFWADYTDEKAVNTIIKMKEEGITSL